MTKTQLTDTTAATQVMQFVQQLNSVEDAASVVPATGNTVGAPSSKSDDVSAVSDKVRDARHLHKLEKQLRRLTGQAVVDFNMLEEGDRVMVCLSGGKDSYTMLEMLLHLQRVAPIRFSLTAVNLDQKQPGFPADVLPTYLADRGVDYHVIERDTYSVVKRVIPDGETTCGLCSRLRRGTLYGFAETHGFNRIALGHHRDDIIETLFLNLFNGGRLQAMPPKLLSDDGKHVLIRPLAYVPEDLIETYAGYKAFPIIPCDLCGSQPNLQRATIKQMLKTWEAQHPGRVESIFSAIGNVRLSQLADRSQFDFEGLSGSVSAQASSENTQEKTDSK